MKKTVISLAVATSLTLSFTSVQASTSANASHHQSSEQKVLKKSMLGKFIKTLRISQKNLVWQELKLNAKLLHLFKSVCLN
nr:hypothetical protein [Priestia aryabhattai]